VKLWENILFSDTGNIVPHYVCLRTVYMPEMCSDYLKNLSLEDSRIRSASSWMLIKLLSCWTS